MADTTGDGRPDIVGFGYHGVWVARTGADGGYGPAELVLDNFGYTAGGWRVDRHPRFLADTSGDGHPDIVGFGDDGVWLARGRLGGGFEPPQFVIPHYGIGAGRWLVDAWRVEAHPRLAADMTGDGHADVVAFGAGGVYVSSL